MKQRAVWILACIGALAFAAALLIGPAPLSLADLWREDATTQTILWEIRAPRSLCAFFVGAALGLAGASLQGLLRNPLADAGVLGLSGFSALGAVLAFAFGIAFLAPLFALVFAFGAAIIVVALGMGARNAATLILIGIGLSSTAGGLIALTLNLAPNPGALSDLVNWTLGSVEGRSWRDVWLVAACFGAGALILAQAGRGLQLLGLGDESARALGLDLARVRLLAIAGAASCIGGATAIAGVIGFVGVAAPHLARGLSGHDPAKLLWPSALLGGVLLLCADILVRVAPTDTELKLGVAASLLGGPFFALIAARLARGAR
jgi:iron complex transport system permease protein